ncbi:TetR/AcrR family transcriptional regulator [Aromatoleum diolicum]|uniref:TetR family transcriptional regulator n=1 Tax=Aromatoleum diolicum TaxID=75796 RepID=A0ABX1QJZ0_9RHOO|nr:TetR/AcrR family transcriptional regulator [Aromatoleum diolicum]NMG77531.1 TetR family transcriptional regulator [Aromatoleum diolicum]
MSADPVEHTRAEARRAQILCAAAECFRSSGFHGASIAQISKAAGMSAGHIYHYFENKEAIIAAIVARDLENLLTLTAEIRSARNVQEAMLERVAEGVDDNLNPWMAGLKLEIVAEASRNPRVAEIVRSADRACRDSLTLTLRDMRRAAGHEDDDATIAAMVEVLAAMFEGLLSRSIRNPDLDRTAVMRRFQGAVRDLLNQTP